MIEHQYVIKDNTIQKVNSETTVVVYDFDEWNVKKVDRYKELLAMKKDMEYAQEYLNQMFFKENTTLIDGALINSSIQLLVKCFQSPSHKGRVNLNSNKVFKSFTKRIGEEDLTKQFRQFYDARNTVLAHDQLDFVKNIVGLAVNIETGNAEDVAEITIRTGFLYKQNKDILLRMVQIVLKYLDYQIECIKNSLIEEYNREKPLLKLIVCDDIPLTTKW